MRDRGLSQLNTILLCCVLYLLVGATRSCVGTRVKCVISLKCHFLKYHVLYLHGACGLSVCDCGEQPEHRTTRRHPAASNAAPWRQAGTHTHTHTEPTVEGACEVPLLVSASASAATRAGSAGGWALWESPCVMRERGCLPGGRKVCLEREGALPEGVKSSPGSCRRAGFDGHAGLSPSHLLALLQKKELGEREVSLRC